MDRKHCSHPIPHFSVLLVQWCVRCSGWRVRRVGVEPGSESDTSSVEVYEAHFLPQEETGPDELQHLIQRTLRAEQEAATDPQALLFDYDAHAAWMKLKY